MEDDISFLSGNNNPKKKGKKKGSDNIKWSSPDNDKTGFLNDGGKNNNDAKSAPSGFFSFLKKDGIAIDKGDLDKTRQEALEAMDKHQAEEIDWKIKNKEAGLKKNQASPDDSFFSIGGDRNLSQSGAGLDPYKINLFNRLIDWWNLRKKRKESSIEEAREKIFSKINIEKEPQPDNLAEDISEETRTAAGNEKGGEEIIRPKKKAKDSFENSNVLETNLMEGEAISFFDWQANASALAISAVIATLIIGAAYGGLMVYGSKKHNEILNTENKSAEVGQKINQAQNDIEQYISLQKKLKFVNQLLDKHLYWTNLFNFLEKKTIADIYYLSFSGDSAGKYTIPARADNFGNLTEQLKIFKAEKDKVKQADISGGKLDSKENEEKTGISFDLEITLNPSVFLKP